MDRKQHDLSPEMIFCIIILFFALVPSSCCFLFLMPRYGKDFKKPLLKSINMDSNNIITIVLDNTNKSKPIGEIHDLQIVYSFDICKYEENENEVIIRKDISMCKEKIAEDNQYRIEINWYGGHLYLETVFQNGQFTVSKERYTNRI